MTVKSSWEPPAVVSFDEVLKLNDEVTAKADAAHRHQRRYFSHS